MNNSIKKGISLFLCFIMAFSLTACSAGTEMSEKNITKTIEKVEKALRDFDREALEKYVSSRTLGYILTLAKENEEVVKLGQAMFEKLEIDIKSIDYDKGTVTLLVKNRDMRQIAADFTQELTQDAPNTLQLLSKLSDHEFLTASLQKLTSEIAEALVPDNPTEVTLKLGKGKHNLILIFDEAGEDAVSGGVLTAVTGIVTGKKTDE